MPNYFFHMATTNRRLSDERGHTLDSLGDAHAHAVGLIYRAFAYLEPEDTERWMINVADEGGRVVLTVLFPRRYVSRSWRSYVTPALSNDVDTPKTRRGFGKRDPKI